jgi:hypothetical protein
VMMQRSARQTGYPKGCNVSHKWCSKKYVRSWGRSWGIDSADSIYIFVVHVVQSFRKTEEAQNGGSVETPSATSRHPMMRKGAFYFCGPTLAGGRLSEGYNAQEEAPETAGAFLERLKDEERYTLPKS